MSAFWLVLLQLIACSFGTSASDEISEVCSTIITQDLTSSQEVFHACGASVLQWEGEGKPVPNLIVLVELMLQAKLFALHAALPLSSAFSSPRPSLFANHDFPTHEVFALEASDSFDVELCLSSSPPPCHPSAYRFVEMELGDLLLVDPARASVRFCAPQGETRGVCVAPPQGNLLHFMLKELRLAAAQREGKPDWVLGRDQDRERLFEMAERMKTKK